MDYRCSKIHALTKFTTTTTTTTTTIALFLRISIIECKKCNNAWRPPEQESEALEMLRGLRGHAPSLRRLLEGAKIKSNSLSIKSAHFISYSSEQNNTNASGSTHKVS